jgi:NADPH:quinone reductase
MRAIVLIESDLPWAELAAIPMTCATAWTCVFRDLAIPRRAFARYT